jgi:hypothetical protein
MTIINPRVHKKSRRKTAGLRAVPQDYSTSKFSRQHKYFCFVDIFTGISYKRFIRRVFA